MRFEGRTVIVTGGASGIGLAMVKGFAAEGAKVVAVDRNEAAFSVFDDLDVQVTPLLADISTMEGIEATIASAGDRLDVLCNNAGVSNTQALHETTLEEYQRNIAVNLTAPFFLIQKALPIMLSQGKGVIINTASVAALRGFRAGAAYTASKWGLAGLTQNVAGTYGPQGIRCCAVCPGGTETGMKSTGALSEFRKRLMERDSERPPRQAPEKVANAAIFLASDEASSINGVILPVEQGVLTF
jgi:NAD(P)-dependent dehydrogenase (short-subunit alcohol dehydrogenase family)